MNNVMRLSISRTKTSFCLQLLKLLQGSDTNGKGVSNLLRLNAKIWDEKGGLNKAGHAAFANNHKNASRHSTMAESDPGRQEANARFKCVSIKQKFISLSDGVKRDSCCNMVDSADNSTKTKFNAKCTKCLVVCDTCDGGSTTEPIDITRKCDKCPLACPRIPEVCKCESVRYNICCACRACRLDSNHTNDICIHIKAMVMSHDHGLFGCIMSWWKHALLYQLFYLQEAMPYDLQWTKKSHTVYSIFGAFRRRLGQLVCKNGRCETITYSDDDMRNDDVYAINSNALISASFGWEFHAWLVGNKSGITIKAFVSITSRGLESNFGRPFVTPE